MTIAFFIQLTARKDVKMAAPVSDMKYVDAPKDTRDVTANRTWTNAKKRNPVTTYVTMFRVVTSVSVKKILFCKKMASLVARKVTSVFII